MNWPAILSRPAARVLAPAAEIRAAQIPAPQIPAAAVRHGRIVFADQLRGAAALCVVVSHLAGLFILMGPMVGWITSTPEVHVGRPAILALTLHAWFNYGAFGVAVFFLISGFVIPFSLRSLSPAGFLVARALRIYPTLWAALSLEWLLTFAQSHLYGRAMAFSPLTYLSNALLVNTIVGSGYVDLVNWTLAVEIKFYLLVVLLRPAILSARLWPLFAWSAFAIAVASAQRLGYTHFSVALASEPMCIGYMLIGTMFHHHFTGRLSAFPALAAGAALGGLFLLCWDLGPTRDQFPWVTSNYVYALGLFLLAYLARGRFRASVWIDWLARISYPLYLLHSILGYSAMTFCIARLGMPYAAALPCGFGVALLAAWALHVAVERPSLEQGKRLARRLGRS